VQIVEKMPIPWGKGYGRFHYQENIQFCRQARWNKNSVFNASYSTGQARGSLFEIFDHLTVALDEGYISAEELEEYKENLFSLIKMTNGYIKYLRKRKAEGLGDNTN